MPRFNLVLKAELDNVKSITPTDSISWMMKIECGACGTVSPKYLDVSSSESVDVPGSRGVCNCLYTCKECRRKIQISVEGNSLKPYTESEKPSAIVSFDVRGGSPCEFLPSEGFVVVSSGDATFDNVSLEDDFAEYDEDAGEAVSIMNMEWTFDSA